MAQTPSTMLPLGTKLPKFSLPDADGHVISTQGASDAPATLVMFLCNHCPFVKLVADEVAKLTAEYIAKGVAVFAINSNDFVKYPDDAPAKMRDEQKLRNYRFPYLVDETQKVAHAFRAACTPDFYVFDREQKLAYRGQMDGARPGNGVAVTGADLRAALDAVLTDVAVTPEQRPSIGCNIKWKAGNEPDYFTPKR